MGLFDINAIESNDAPNKPPGYNALREQIIATSADYESSCWPLSPSSVGIENLAFSPEAALVASGNATQLVLFAPEVHKGVLGAGLDLGDATASAGTTSECVVRDDGLVFYDRSSAAIHPRLVPIKQKFAAAGRVLNPRFGSVSYYKDEAGDDYILAAAGDLGLVALHIGPAVTPYLTEDSLAGLIWVPNGVVAVRTIARSHLATLVDGTGRVFIADLSKIEERYDTAGNPTTGMFATPLGALNGSGVAGEIGVNDPRIIWASDGPLVTGTIAPIFDPDTGFLYSGDTLGRRMRVTPAIDPKVQMVIDRGDELVEVDGVTPLGIAPREGFIDATKPNASAAAFRIEVTLPSGTAKALQAIGSDLKIAVESEFVANVATAQTPVQYPRAHLRESDRAGVADARATTLVLRPEIPPTLEEELRHQKSSSKYTSGWIVSIADPRASEKFVASADQKAAAGCAACIRPLHLRGRTEADGVYELWTSGRFITVRADGISATPYDYLSKNGRLAGRFTTTRARKVRPVEALVPANNPPVADGMLQETHYIHSGEIETASVDLNAGGRAGVDVVIARTYRSRTLGGELGEGWDSTIFRLLLSLPNGDVEYHDGAGEVWLFTLDEIAGTYVSPSGLFLKLIRTQRGFAMIDQAWRIAEFNERGQILSESDEFYDATKPGSGNTIHYVYDEAGQLAKILDPLNRATELSYWGADAAIVTCPYPGATDDPCGYPGRLREVKTTWRNRSVAYLYDRYSRLTGVQLPEFKAGSGVPGNYDQSGDKRPKIEYTYQPATSVHNDLVELAGNLTSIKDPEQTKLGIAGKPRVTFTYDLTTDANRDRNISQTWASGELATFTPTENVDVLGQRRTYTLTPAGTNDLRRHFESKRVHEVPVMEVSAAGPPDVVSATLAPAKLPQLETNYTYNSFGLVLMTTMPSGLLVRNV